MSRLQCTFLSLSTGMASGEVGDACPPLTRLVPQSLTLPFPLPLPSQQCIPATSHGASSSTETPVMTSKPASSHLTRPSSRAPYRADPSPSPPWGIASTRSQPSATTAARRRRNRAACCAAAGALGPCMLPVCMSPGCSGRRRRRRRRRSGCAISVVCAMAAAPSARRRSALTGRRRVRGTCRGRGWSMLARGGCASPVLLKSIVARDAPRRCSDGGHRRRPRCCATVAIAGRRPRRRTPSRVVRPPLASGRACHLPLLRAVPVLPPP